MNTPKTKSPKRWVFNPDKFVVNGTFSLALTDENFIEALGIMASVWPHIEENMINVFQSLLIPNGPLGVVPVRQIYKSIVNAQIRIKIMKNLLEQTYQNASKGKEYDDLIDEFSSLNDLRNKYIHGQWTTHEDGRVFISEYSLDDLWILSGREVKLEEINNVINRMFELQKKLMKFMFSENERRAMELTPSQDKSLEPRD